MDIKTASVWLEAIKGKYIHGGDDSYDEQRKEAIDFAIKTMNDQQNLIWELQDLNEHLEDRQKKIRVLVNTDGKWTPLDKVPVEPIRGGSGDGSKVWYLCGDCHYPVDLEGEKFNYCQNCGRPVKWEG